MRTDIKLGRVFGIEIGLHYSWFLIAFLIVLSVAGEFSAAHKDWGQLLIWSLSVLTALLFFVSLLVHELAHSLVAKSRNLPVRSITLFALGGVSQIEKNPSDAQTEFWMAIVGPITSCLIGGVCLGLARLCGWAAGASGTTPVVAMIVWLGYINFGLGIFNLIPGYPLDGGRVLHAAIWWKTGKADQSTRIAARIGEGVGFAFIALGVMQVFAGAALNGLWIAFIGWFLIQAAAESYREVEVAPFLTGRHVADLMSDLMSNDCPMVDGHLDVQHFVDDEMLRSGKRCFLVEENGVFAGLITPTEIKHVERSHWPSTRLSSIMLPAARLHSVTPETSLKDALELMATNDLNQLPVVANGHLRGTVSRSQVLQLFRTRAELQV
jgi:Zn-dependent protease/predicted transcriptional regulator